MKNIIKLQMIGIFLFFFSGTLSAQTYYYCSGHGTLKYGLFGSYCQCDPAYTWNRYVSFPGLQSVVDKYKCVPDPCYQQECSGHGTCNLSVFGTAYCSCEQGYEHDPSNTLSCVDDEVMDYCSSDSRRFSTPVFPLDPDDFNWQPGEILPNHVCLNKMTPVGSYGNNSSTWNGNNISSSTVNQRSRAVGRLVVRVDNADGTAEEISGCSGTLISKHFFLVAGHCIGNSELVGVKFDYRENGELFEYGYENGKVVRNYIKDGSFYPVNTYYNYGNIPGVVDSFAGKWKFADYAIIALKTLRPFQEIDRGVQIDGVSVVPTPLINSDYLIPGESITVIGHPGDLPMKANSGSYFGTETAKDWIEEIDDTNPDYDIQRALFGRYDTSRIVLFEKVPLLLGSSGSGILNSSGKLAAVVRWGDGANLNYHRKVLNGFIDGELEPYETIKDIFNSQDVHYNWGTPVKEICDLSPYISCSSTGSSVSVTENP